MKCVLNFSKRFHKCTLSIASWLSLKLICLLVRSAPGILKQTFEAKILCVRNLPSMLNHWATLISNLNCECLEIFFYYNTCLMIYGCLYKHKKLVFLRKVHTNIHVILLIPLDKMAAISQTTFYNEFSWMNVLYFDSTFTEVPMGYAERQGFDAQWYTLIALPS